MAWTPNIVEKGEFNLETTNKSKVPEHKLQSTTDFYRERKNLDHESMFEFKIRIKRELWEKFHFDLQSYDNDVSEGGDSIIGILQRGFLKNETTEAIYKNLINSLHTETTTNYWAF